jgi:glycosyltransferase involved in cell wall biosynthesis
MNMPAPASLLMSGDEYRESLRRYRPRVFLDGRLVESVVDEPGFAPGMNAIALTYDYALKAQYAKLMTAVQQSSGKTVNRLTHINTSAGDLLNKLEAVRLVCQEHGGPALGRNLGVSCARGEVIVFIDSDLVVLPDFLSQHSQSLRQAWQRQGNRLCFTYGAVINTHNFDNPTAEPHKLSDYSWAYFATGNVAIDKQLLEQSGLFDSGFRLYGWEDLELGERLRRLGVQLVPCPGAKGYHWHPPLSLDQLNATFWFGSPWSGSAQAAPPTKPGWPALRGSLSLAGPPLP